MASNGAWQDVKTGRFIAGGKPVTAIQDTETAIAYHRLKEEKQLAGMLAANNGAGRLSPSGMAEDTWADIAEKLASEAIDGKGIARVQSAQTLGKMTGFIPGAGKNGNDSGPAPGRLRVTADMDQDQLMEFISNWRAAGQPGSQADGEKE